MTIHDLMRLCELAGLQLVIDDDARSPDSLRVEGNPRADQLAVIEANKIALWLVLQYQERLAISPSEAHEHLVSQLVAMDATVSVEATGKGEGNVD